MNLIERVLLMSIFLLAGCAGPDTGLDSELRGMRDRIAQAREELKAHGKGSVVHDLITLRIAIHEQTLAMLEQRGAAGKAQVPLSYTVDGKPYIAPGSGLVEVTRLERRLKDVRMEREYDLKQAQEAGDPFKPLYAMSAATKAIQISQLEYQLEAYRNGFPPYYVPFQSPAAGSTPPQTIEIPAGKSAVIQ